MNVSFYLLPKNEVCYLMEEESIAQGLRKMRKKGYQTVPVINKDGAYCGTVSEGDFLRALTSDFQMDFDTMGRASLKTLRKKSHYKPVSIDARISELDEKIIDQNFVPVVDGRGIFIGIVTRKAILMHLLRKYTNK